jgi:hypothetical protein
MGKQRGLPGCQGTYIAEKNTLESRFAPIHAKSSWLVKTNWHLA